MVHERRVDAGGPEPPPQCRDLRLPLRPCRPVRDGLACGGDPRDVRQLGEQGRLTVRPQRETQAYIREPLADEALRGVDQEHGRLETPLREDEVRLLPRVLQVVAGERLVSDDANEVRGTDRQVHVQVHA